MADVKLIEEVKEEDPGEVKEEGGGGGVKEKGGVKEEGGGGGVKGNGEMKEEDGGGEVKEEGGGGGVKEEGGGVKEEGNGETKEESGRGGVKEEGGGGGVGEEATKLDPISPLDQKIIRQVEFYFGNRNLPKDKFLQQAIASDKDGWVPMATLLTFNRLKALSSDSACIAAALRKSTNGVVEVSDEGERVRRSPSNPAPDSLLSPELRKQIRGKSIYTKGFPEDTSLDDLQEFFDHFGKIQYIQMRRHLLQEGRKFKGSVFVEFAEKDEADSFLALPDVQFKGVQLLRESKEMYFKRKAEEKKALKEEKRQEDQQAQEAARDKKNKTTVPRAVLHFKGCGPGATFEQIKEVFQEFATVAFVDFSRGDVEGYVRFQEEGGAEKAAEGLKGSATDGETPQLCGGECEVRVLEGEEEQEYWDKVVDSRLKRGGKFSKRGGKKGYFGRKRHQQSSGEGPARKQAKSEN